jgi:hypothetical protein
MPSRVPVLFGNIFERIEKLIGVLDPMNKPVKNKLAPSERSPWEKLTPTIAGTKDRVTMSNNFLLLKVSDRIPDGN